MAHTAANYGGGPYFVGARSGGVKNNGGTVLYGGNITNNGPITQAPSTSILGFRSGLTTGPFVGVANGVSKSIAGTFAKMAAGKYILMGFTSQIAGNTNTMLNSPANFGPHLSENRAQSTVRTTRYVTTGGWNYVTGQGINPTVFTDDIKSETYPGTYAIPGRITYLSSGKSPVTKSYAARTD